MAHRFAKFYQPVDRLQWSLPIHDRAQLPAGGTRLRLGEAFCPGQRQPLRCPLGYRSSQGMARRLQDMEPHILL